MTRTLASSAASRAGEARARIAFVAASLGPGGSERIISRLASEFARRDHGVGLITLASREGDFYTVDSRVERVGLGLMAPSRSAAASLGNNAKRLLSLRRILLSLAPDVVVSFVDRTNVLALAACLGMRVRVVVCERCDPTQQPRSRPWDFARSKLYRLASAVVVQTPTVAEWAYSLAARERVVVIPNFVDEPSLPGGTAWWSGDRSRIVAIGRLSAEKGFDLLLAAFARVAAVHPEWDLHIAGDGPLRTELKQLARALGLADRVVFHGLVTDVGGLLRSARIFTLPSRNEGFPNVLLEAMAHGVAPVSFDCPSGPRHIIRDGFDGVLVPPENVQRLAEALGHLIVDPVLRARLARNGLDVIRRFGFAPVFLMWQAVIDGTRGPGKPEKEDGG